jgi:hypothetical protein
MEAIVEADLSGGADAAPGVHDLPGVFQGGGPRFLHVDVQPLLEARDGRRRMQRRG